LRPSKEIPEAIPRSGETLPVEIGYQSRPSAEARHLQASLLARNWSTSAPLVRLICATLGPATGPFPIADSTHAKAVGAAVPVSTIGAPPPPPSSGTRGKASSPVASLSPTSAAERGPTVCGGVIESPLSLSRRTATVETATSERARP